MAKKETVSKKKHIEKKIHKTHSNQHSEKKMVHEPKKAHKPATKKDFPTLNIARDPEIALDFATKVYERFNKMVKSVVLFGSTAKQTAVPGSDIDIIILIDDVSIEWDQELISWYREEIDKLVRQNPYKRTLHINTIKLSTWWDDLMRGDPTVINVIRYGESLIDFGGFFEPLKFLLIKGKIRSTAEAVYNCLERAPQHFVRSQASILSAVEGLYWAMVDAAHAALISRNVLPPSPEYIALNLRDIFVSEGRLNIKYVTWYRDLLFLYKKISHGEIHDVKGVEIDIWQQRTDEFIKVMAKLVESSIASPQGSISVDVQQPQMEPEEPKKD